MEDKSTLPRHDDERVRSVPSAADATQKRSDTQAVHVDISDLEKEATGPPKSPNVAQTDVVDWEGEDDPAKPMNW
jgi:hypothetical protein